MATPRRSLVLVPLAVVAVAVAVAVLVAGQGAARPSPAPSASAVTAVLTPSPSVVPVTTAPTFTPPPSPTPSPTLSPTPSPPTAPATRVVIPALKIDLAITKSPPAGVYPYCNVAMVFGKPFGQPGQPRATYLFAHARDGMFGPIYQLTMVKRTPRVMVGMLVDVYTSDSVLHVYQITRVLPHQLTLNRALAAVHDQLWLQTSEGPHGTPGKTQVVAEPVSTAPAAYADAHPPVHVVRCG